ncbi:MAG: hypothetical protein COB49_01640 [Alphaproteobacteria bacterium]|nr:MAG: hypothetical protein COB49_01640 [Alphaproteobacteria bacterium]
MEIIPNWHPLLVHFTIALYVISALLFALAYFVVKNGWQEKFTGAAYINLWLGALISLLTVAAGIYAYNTVGHDAPSHLAMTDHRNWALVTAVFLWVLAIWSVFSYRAGKTVGLLFVVAMLMGSGLLGITGLKGGEIVYRYGLGVMSLPKVEGEGHSHSHEEGKGHGSNVAPVDHDDSGTEPHSHEDEASHGHEEPKTDDGHDHDH